MSNSIQLSLGFNMEYKAIAITTTSVSTDLFLIMWMPCLDITCTCTNPCVSASSCVQGKKKLLLYGWLQITVSSKAHIINLLWLKLLLSMTFERKRNNSDSFSSIRRKTYHLFDGCELCSTFLLIPLPCFFRVAAFKLIFHYLSSIKFGYLFPNSFWKKNVLSMVCEPF